MSEYSESYYLRSEEQNEGVQLLERARLHGYVFPPSGGWVQILADGPKVVPNIRLLGVNSGILLHYVVPDGVSVSLEVYEGQVPRFRFGKDDSGEVVTDAAGCDPGQLGEVIGLSTPQVQEFSTIACCRDLASIAKGSSIAHRLAMCLGLQNFALTNYASFDRCYDEESSEFDAIEVTPTDERSSRHRPAVVSRQFDSVPQFPVVFFGHAVQVRRATRKLLKRVWELGNWRDPVRDLKIVTFEQLSRTILIEYSPIHVSNGETVWRLGDIGDAFSQAYVRSSEKGTKEGHSKYQRLLLEGMHNYFWFTVSLLNNREIGNFTTYGSKVEYATICRNVLAEFVHWLPEILLISNCLVDSSEFLGTGPSWEHQIVHVALNAGWATDIANLARMRKQEVVDAMLSDGVIEEVSGRYQLLDSFGTST